MPNLPKICFIAPTLNPDSGWGRLSREVIVRIKDGGKFDVSVLTYKKSGFSGEYPVLRSGWFGFIVSVFRSRKFFRECDIIHVFDGWPYAAVACLGSLFLSKPIFITAVGTYSVLPLDRFFQGILLRFAYRKAKKIMAISAYTKNEIVKRIPLKNMEVVNLGVDFEKFHRAYRDPRKKQDVILSVGELKQRKGYHVALEAFFKVRNKFPDLKYIIAGSGNNENSGYYQYLRELIKKNNAENSVVFPGDVSESFLLEFYQEAKIFVLPSVNANGAFEGFGLVLLEANAAGIPVIGTTPSGMDDIVDNGKNGFLVPPNDSVALSSAFVQILSNVELQVHLSAGAVAKARSMSWEKTAELYSASWFSLLPILSTNKNNALPGLPSR